MNKIICLLLCGAVAYTSGPYEGSTMAPVILAGSIVKHSGTEIAKKYKRKDCPVCKGAGKYLSGDQLKWVDCGYCEPEPTEDAVVHPEVKIYDTGKTTCKNKNCKCKDCKCKNCGCLPSVE